MKGLFAGIIGGVLVIYLVEDDHHSKHPPGILVSSSPYQRLIAGDPGWNEGSRHITPLADYHLQVRILRSEPYWFDHGSDVSPLDLAVGWGPLSDQSVLDEMSVSQGQRWYSYWPRHDKFPISSEEINSHSANMHMIPASPEILKQLRRLREGDIADLDGSLVEVQWPDGGKWTSSLSRSDVGNGACELMWVRSVIVRE